MYIWINGKQIVKQHGFSYFAAVIIVLYSIFESRGEGLGSCALSQKLTRSEPDLTYYLLALEGQASSC